MAAKHLAALVAVCLKGNMDNTQPITRVEAQWTIAPVLTANSDPVRPEWIRLPRSGQACRYTSLKRSLLNSLVLPCAANRYKPPVRSVVLRKKGNLTGVRLIHLQSLLDYIESQKP
jgi:hypothetical protein